MALFSDAFTNTAQTPLTTHGWTRTGADNLGIANSGTALGLNGGATATWTIFTPPTQPSSADHYAQGVLIAAGTTWLPLGVRVNATNKTGYFARRTSAAIVLYRGNNGTLTQLGSYTGGSASTVVKVVASGSTLTVYADGVAVIGPVTDTTYPSDTGVGLLTRGGAATYGDSFDSWESSENSSAVTGALAATESGSDTFAASGSVIVSGALAAAETGSDTASVTGSVIVSGTMAATEAGADVFSASGPSGISGVLAATEAPDTFAASGNVIVFGALAAVETGSDTFTTTDSAARTYPLTALLAYPLAGASQSYPLRRAA